MRALKDNGRAVMASGIDLYMAKAQAVFISAMPATFAGVILGHYYRFPSTPCQLARGLVYWTEMRAGGPWGWARRTRNEDQMNEQDLEGAGQPEVEGAQAQQVGVEVQSATLGGRRSWIWLVGFVLVLFLAQAAFLYLRGAPGGELAIAFMSDRNGDYEIFLVDPQGENLINLTNNPAEDGAPAWSPVAGALAFLSTRGEMPVSLMRMELDGGNVITLDDEILLAGSAPVWSPTGEWLAFDSAPPDSSNIYLARADGSEVRQLTDTPGADRFASWSPDGSHLLFISNRNSIIGIYRIAVQGGEAELLSDPMSVNAMPAYSPDGRRIAFVSNRDNDVDIYVMDADGSNVVRLTDTPDFDGYPRWSPDGRKIAFLTNRDGNPEIYVMNADGSDQVNLTNNPAQDSLQGDFEWSPDGRYILFHSDREGSVDVYVMNADGSNPVNVSRNEANDFGGVWVQR